MDNLDHIEQMETENDVDKDFETPSNISFDNDSFKAKSESDWSGDTAEDRKVRMREALK